MIRQPAPAGYAQAAADLDWDAVKADLKAFFKTSDESWPSDYGNYAPFYVRLAWHCAGSYRTSDGRGGCDGGRQRFLPEEAWEDNTNLDKARGMLWPIKEKYGLGLSWGDLFILAGTTAIESMGGPVLGFCAGRIDDADGSASITLGPSDEQNELYPCPVNGECEEPLGSSTIGLIYLNPAGPMGVPDPAGSAPEVRDTFARMAMNDTETVALIGGGHSFGKTHGACPDGAGPDPVEDPANPWPGLCGTGKGIDAFTSGFEGPWTTNPTSWDNEYYTNLLNYDWTLSQSPAEHPYWVVAEDSPVAPAADGNGTQHLMMMTSDISLLHDPEGEYIKIVEQFAKDPAAFDDAFSHAWYKLVTRDMGPITRCLGDNVPPAQDWQYPLPDAPAVLADFDAVAESVEELIAGSDDEELAPALVRLAWQCASTFRQTDYQGGCNGARLRLAPQNAWPVNEGLDATLEALAPVMEKFEEKAKGGGGALSWADLIVLSANVALGNAGGRDMQFCGGRVDALDGDLGSQYLAPKDITSVAVLREAFSVMGLTPRESVVMMGGMHSLGNESAPLSLVGPAVAGGVGSWTATPAELNNEYFKNLATEKWEAYGTAGQYKAVGKDLYMSAQDLMLKFDSELNYLVQELAQDNEAFLDEFALVWTKLMNADRFDGPTGSVCV